MKCMNSKRLQHIKRIDLEGQRKRGRERKRERERERERERYSGSIRKLMQIICFKSMKCMKLRRMQHIKRFV